MPCVSPHHFKSSMSKLFIDFNTILNNMRQYSQSRKHTLSKRDISIIRFCILIKNWIIKYDRHILFTIKFKLAFYVP